MSSFQHQGRMLLLQILFVSSMCAIMNHNTLQVDHFTIDMLQADNKSCPPWKYHKYHKSSQWPTNSLIQAFGTFFLLSYVKTINTSFDILMPVRLYNVSGKPVGWYLYYNGSMEYFGSDHLPYAVLAIFMFVTFNLLPLLLLCLYPCWCFQSCLNCCHLNSQVLRTFIDAFQGCYKFEPYDCRYWAAFYLFLRILFLAVFAFTQSGYWLLVSGIFLKWWRKTSTAFGLWQQGRIIGRLALQWYTSLTTWHCSGTNWDLINLTTHTSWHVQSTSYIDLIVNNYRVIHNVTCTNWFGNVYHKLIH